MFMWYEHKARDFKLMAANLARSYDKYITMENIKLYERMIRESSWWDVCDNMTPNIIGRLLEKFPDQMWPVLDKWNKDEHLWIRRTTLLCQMKFGEKTNGKKLFEYCQNCITEENYYIKKAIGRALRLYSQVKPFEVINFLQSNSNIITPIRQKEDSKNLSYKKKFKKISAI